MMRKRAKILEMNYIYCKAYYISLSVLKYSMTLVPFIKLTS